jgi:hypothetical protein
MVQPVGDSSQLHGTMLLLSIPSALPVAVVGSQKVSSMLDSIRSMVW